MNKRNKRRLKTLSGLRIGDTIEKVRWEAFCTDIPETIAFALIRELVPEAIITKKGLSALKVPLQNWDTNLGVIVTIEHRPSSDEEVLWIIHKASDGTFALIKSKPRPVTPKKQDNE